MLDIKLIREHPEIVRKDIEKRGEPEKIEMLNNLIQYDIDWRNLLTEANELRHKRKQITAEVANLKKQGKDASKQIEQAKQSPNKSRNWKPKLLNIEKKQTRY